MENWGKNAKALLESAFHVNDWNDAASQSLST